MLDTIVLMLNSQQFEVFDMERFTPSARGLLCEPYYPLGKQKKISCTQNPTKSEMAADGYKPRLTLTRKALKGGCSTALRIEFSAPKLLFGNNFDELKTNNFEEVLKVLHQKLEKMGVRVNLDILRQAKVIAIHYSKNIVLTDHTSCSMVLAMLARADVTARLDLGQTDYRNGGHAIRYHANSFEVIFYDKVKDLQQSKISDKRALERDNAIQVGLFNKIVLLSKQLQVLRMEVRLGKSAKIRALFGKLGINSGLFFETMFSEVLSKKILEYYWNEIRSAAPTFCSATQFKPEQVLGFLVRQHGKLKAAKLLQLLGATLMVSSVGVRGTMAFLNSSGGSRNLQRIKREIDNIDLNDVASYNALKVVDAALTGFVPVKLRDYEMPACVIGG